MVQAPPKFLHSQVLHPSGWVNLSPTYTITVGVTTAKLDVTDLYNYDNLVGVTVRGEYRGGALR